MSAWLDYILFLLGFVLLVKGADFLVEGASQLAKKIGISTLIVGLTIVAFGTQVPELVIGMFSALKGSTDIALGNSIGSNIFNTLVVGGVAAVIIPIHVSKTTVWKEIPYSILAVGVLYVMVNKRAINGFTSHNIILRTDGIILITFFILFVVYLFELTIKHKEEVISNKDIENIQEEVQRANWINIFFIIGGMISLFFGGQWVVDGAVNIARKFNISEFIISTTIVAMGTSLPELATTITAAIKKEHDLCMGNIIGSNIYNILLALGMTSTITAVKVPLGVNYDLVFLILISIIMFLFMFTGEKKGAPYKLHRSEGIIFLILYIGYILYVILRGPI